MAEPEEERALEILLVPTDPENFSSRLSQSFTTNLVFHQGKHDKINPFPNKLYTTINRYLRYKLGVEHSE